MAKNTFDELVGHKILSMWINDTDEDLWFEVDIIGGRGSEYLHYRTEGDCCNRVWFCYFNFINFVFNRRVMRTYDFAWEDVAKDDYLGGDDDEEKVMFEIKVVGGVLHIEVRNSNNGYYGGDVRFIGVQSLRPNSVVRLTEQGRERILPDPPEENFDV